MSTRRSLVAVAALSCIILFTSAFAIAQSNFSPKYRVWTPSPQTTAAIAVGTTTQVTVRHWSSSFSFSGHSYHYSMVGTNPSSGSATTTISTEIQPLNFIFSDGKEVKSGSKVTPLIDSPIFQKASLPGGYGQLADVEQRSNFHATVAAKSPNYHLRLAQPLLLSAITIHVPSTSGSTITLGNGIVKGYVDYTFMSQTVSQVLAQKKFNGTTLPILLAGDIGLYDNTLRNCCVVGFHGADSAAPGELVTFIYTSYPTPGASGTTFSDITAASHEVAEWMDDPFVNNVVPPWGDPAGGIGADPTVCVNNLLEVGDPIENFANPVFLVTVNGKTYHPQDIAFFSWFAHQKTSIGLHGQYSYISPEKLKSPPPSCH